ncbi:LOW QUALITY PROTEIN: uncharacterized protein [Primulina eburnea]|uniref:LOW QUALITY PROTEIN: uncharacterized protein n=1 Tax=Primulina eburnea TaxID=1245227 RepID=UPI003C6C3251
MEISVISDSISTVVYSTQGLAFSNFLLNRPCNVLSPSDASADNPHRLPSSSAAPFRISAVGPPPTKTLTKPRLRRTRRVKLKPLIIDYDGSVGDELFVFSDGGGCNNGDGYSGGNGSGGGRRGWNFGGYGGGANWDESSGNSISDPAFDFVYEILCWIAMSNCLHFAFKKVVRNVADGIGDPAREKVVPMPLTPVC